MEAHARSRIQVWLQDLLEVEVEVEVTEFLGRGKSQRQAPLAPTRVGYRNGYGKPRRVALTAPRLMRDAYDEKRFKDGIAVRAMIEPTRKAA